MAMTSPDPSRALADELEAWPATGRGDGLDAAVVSKLMKRAAAALRSPTPFSGTAVMDEMVTAAMREFERMSSVLRYREKDKWHSCDIMGMRDALRAAFALLPDPQGAALPRDAERETVEDGAEIVFLDGDGNQHRIVYDIAEDHAPLGSGWFLHEDDPFALPSIPPREGPVQSTTEQADASRDHPVREALEQIAKLADTTDPEAFETASGEETMYGEGMAAGLRAAGRMAKAALSPSPTSVMPDGEEAK